MGKKNAVWKNREAVEAAFLGANSMSEVLDKLGEHKGSASYAALKLYAKQYRLDVPTYVPKFDKNKMKKRPLEEVLTKDSTYSRASIKARLVSELGWEYKCSDPMCPNPSPTWKGKKLIIQLDHINGCPTDNRVENLRFLCPNCHSQTETFGSTKKSPRRAGICLCGEKSATGRCRSCAAKARNHRKGDFKINWPPLDELLSALHASNFSSCARKLGVSDVAVRKHLEALGVDPKTLRVL